MGALWALCALPGAHRLIRQGLLHAQRLPSPKLLPDGGRAGADAILRRLHVKCLARALLLQCWDLAHGHPQDVIVGTRGGHGEIAAHAWLLTDPPSTYAGYTELWRIPFDQVSRR
jgi:hypothetical protein